VEKEELEEEEKGKIWIRTIRTLLRMFLRSDEGRFKFTDESLWPKRKRRSERKIYDKTSSLFRHDHIECCVHDGMNWLFYSEYWNTAINP
jgi:hypothetical protein